VNATWEQNGITVAGGNGPGAEMNQLHVPHGLFIDDNQALYIAEYSNHRIVKWNFGATQGKIVAGGNGPGDRNDQLYNPGDVILDKAKDYLFIGDAGNNRVVRWSLRGARSGETITNDGSRSGALTMDEQGFLYIVDSHRQEVRRWRVGDSQGTVVAGGNGAGNQLDQLHGPTKIFVDQDGSIYVSDAANSRVMKWMKGAKVGTVVAGGNGKGNALSQLSDPTGIVVDQVGTVYIADRSNHRIMRWRKGATEGDVVVGKDGGGSATNQLNQPLGLSFDRNGNLFVTDHKNCRIQKFGIKITP
jgi:sugar lactone lactonase YvrE